MQSVHVIYKGKSQNLENIETYRDIVIQLGKNPKDIFYVKSNNQFYDLASHITEKEIILELFDKMGEHRNDYLWHTAAHILAQAVNHLYKSAQEAIGPVTSTGFFQDIDFGSHTLHPDELEAIKSEMQSIIKANYIIEKREVTQEEALKIFKNNPYKLQNIKDIPNGVPITLYKQGDYEDLCRGPHLSSTGQVGAFLLTNISAAYFRGDNTQKSLQRISGIAFTDEKELRKYEQFIEEAKKRDHRKIGQELDLFSFHPEGPGFPFWHAKGDAIFNELVNYKRRQNSRRGYTEIKTPQTLSDELWKKSGHYENFKENMYFTDIDERNFALKPMNCPGGCLVYKSKLHSYRDLPLRQAEFGLVHRHELSGALHGLFRVRSFTQDDAHVFCTKEQLATEIRSAITYNLDLYKDFGFDNITIFLATRPDKSIGSDEDWQLATEALTSSLTELGLEYKIKEKEGAFYGPKLEFNIKDSLERFWQCGTVQVDFSMPSRFGLEYEGSDGKPHTPIMLHIAIFGSLERFLGILLEHYSGKLPLWISPIQVHLINVSDVFLPYLQETMALLRKHDIRVDSDVRNETLGYKIRHANSLKVPFIGIIGEKEVTSKTITVRDRENNNIEYSMTDFIRFIQSDQK